MLKKDTMTCKNILKFIYILSRLLFTRPEYLKCVAKQNILRLKPVLVEVVAILAWRYIFADSRLID